MGGAPPWFQRRAASHVALNAKATLQIVVQRSLEGKQDLDMEGAGQRGRLAQRVGDGGGRGVQTDQRAGRTGLGEGLCGGLDLSQRP